MIEYIQIVKVASVYAVYIRDCSLLICLDLAVVTVSYASHLCKSMATSAAWVKFYDIIKDIELIP